MDHPRVSLRDIAAKAGVTAAAVSMALRNSPEISAKRREEIKKLALQMKYRPDPALTALAEYRRQRRHPQYQEQLAFLYQTSDAEPLDSWSKYPIRKEMIAGMKERAGDLGYGLEIHDIGVEPARQKQISRMLRTRGIRGLLIHPNLQTSESVFVHFKAFAVLNILQFAEHPTLHGIHSNDFVAMQTALKKLYSLGYRNPLYAEGEIQHGFLGPEKRAVFDCFMRDYPGTTCQRLFYHELQENASAILRAKPKIDVILTHNYKEIEDLAKATHFRIPQDFGLCFLFTSLELPQYAGINVHAHVIGKRAIETVDLMLRHNEIGTIKTPSTIFVHPTWQDGPSIPRKGKQKILSKNRMR